MPSGVANALLIAAMLAFAYLLLIRPQRKRAQEVAALQSTLSSGDEVMLTSGIFGRVEAVDDDKVAIEVSPGVVVTVHRGAIAKIVVDAPDDDVDAVADPEVEPPTHQAPGATSAQPRPSGVDAGPPDDTGRGPGGGV